MRSDVNAVANGGGPLAPPTFQEGLMRMVGTRRIVLTSVAAIVSAAVAIIQPASAQVSQARTTIDADTTFVVRTSEAIDVKNADGLVFTGTIEEDVLDRYGDVA